VRKDPTILNKHSIMPDTLVIKGPGVLELRHGPSLKAPTFGTRDSTRNGGLHFSPVSLNFLAWLIAFVIAVLSNIKEEQCH
jgi:hypothetical protein